MANALTGISGTRSMFKLVSVLFHNAEIGICKKYIAN
jgi:hypothetical protein